jgi:hypothetical protein
MLPVKIAPLKKRHVTVNKRKSSPLWTPLDGKKLIVAAREIENETFVNVRGGKNGAS